MTPAGGGSPWPLTVRLSDVVRGARALDLEAGADVRAATARALDLVALTGFTARVRLAPWLDGAQVEASWTAEVTRLCGVTLEPFDVQLAGEFRVRLAPASDQADPLDNVEALIDLDGEDPPDPLVGEVIEVGALLVEHLAIELDPFPRAPGAVFEPPAQPPEASPFAALSALRPSKG